MLSFSKPFIVIQTWLSAGCKFRVRIHLGMKCLRESGSISSFSDGTSLYQLALAETLLGNVRKSGKKRRECFCLSLQIQINFTPEGGGDQEQPQTVSPRGAGHRTHVGHFSKTEGPKEFCLEKRLSATKRHCQLLTSYVLPKWNTLPQEDKHQFQDLIGPAYAMTSRNNFRQQVFKYVFFSPCFPLFLELCGPFQDTYSSRQAAFSYTPQNMM